MAGESDILGSALGLGMGAATGNPIAMASGAIGLGMSIFGGVSQSNAASKTAEAEKNIYNYEIQQDAVRKQSMQLSAHRQEIDVVRNAQRARSQALNSATNQGAQFGSGLQGGYGQIAGEASWNNLGISQNLQFGEQMFDLNSRISQQRSNIAGYQSQSATAAGVSKIGGTLMSSFNPVRNLSGNFLGSSGGVSNTTGFSTNPWSATGMFGNNG